MDPTTTRTMDDDNDNHNNSNATISPSLVNAAANNNTRSVLWSVVDDLALDVQQARQQQP